MVDPASSTKEDPDNSKQKLTAAGEQAKEDEKVETREESRESVEFGSESKCDWGLLKNVGQKELISKMTEKHLKEKIEILEQEFYLERRKFQELEAQVRANQDAILEGDEMPTDVEVLQRQIKTFKNEMKMRQTAAEFDSSELQYYKDLCGSIRTELKAAELNVSYQKINYECKIQKLRKEWELEMEQVKHEAQTMKNECDHQKMKDQQRIEKLEGMTVELNQDITMVRNQLMEAIDPKNMPEEPPPKEPKEDGEGGEDSEEEEEDSEDEAEKVYQKLHPLLMEFEKEKKKMEASCEQEIVKAKKMALIETSQLEVEMAHLMAGSRKCKEQMQILEKENRELRKDMIVQKQIMEEEKIARMKKMNETREKTVEMLKGALHPAVKLYRTSPGVFKKHPTAMADPLGHLQAFDHDIGRLGVELGEDYSMDEVIGGHIGMSLEGDERDEYVKMLQAREAEYAIEYEPIEPENNEETARARRVRIEQEQEDALTLISERISVSKMRINHDIANEKIDTRPHYAISR